MANERIRDVRVLSGNRDFQLRALAAPQSFRRAAPHPEFTAPAVDEGAEIGGAGNLIAPHYAQKGTRSIEA